jgi:hypothetical protein
MVVKNDGIYVPAKFQDFFTTQASKYYSLELQQANKLSKLKNLHIKCMEYLDTQIETRRFSIAQIVMFRGNAWANFISEVHRYEFPEDYEADILPDSILRSPNRKKSNLSYTETVYESNMKSEEHNEEPILRWIPTTPSPTEENVPEEDIPEELIQENISNVEPNEEEVVINIEELSHLLTEKKMNEEKLDVNLYKERYNFLNTHYKALILECSKSEEKVSKSFNVKKTVKESDKQSYARYTYDLKLQDAIAKLYKKPAIG